MGAAEVEEMERNTKDLKAAKKIFYEMVVPDERKTLLKIPPFKTPLSLSGLILAMYGRGGHNSCMLTPCSDSSDSESPSQKSTSSSSSGNSERESLSPNSSPEGDWSQVFSKDGHWSLDLILAQLPPLRPLEVKFGTTIYRASLTCAAHGLRYYNSKNQGDEYEFVAPLLCNSFSPTSYGHVYHKHSNFLARPKNHCSSPFGCPVQLFFVEWKCQDILEDDDPGVICEIVVPKIPSSDMASPYAEEIYHPPDVYCPHCS